MVKLCEKENRWLYGGKKNMRNSENTFVNQEENEVKIDLKCATHLDALKSPPRLGLEQLRKNCARQSISPYYIVKEKEQFLHKFFFVTENKNTKMAFSLAVKSHEHSR